jgi:choline-sulfatase
MNDTVPGHIRLQSGMSKKTNILFIQGEQHHPRALTPAGVSIPRTPNLQRLATEGAYLPNTYCAGPLCVPSRTSTLLSRWVHQSGIDTNTNEDRIGEQPNLARQLRDSGYRTCHVGKTHLATGEETTARFERLGFTDELLTRGKINAAAKDNDDHYARFLKDQGLWQTFHDDYARRRNLRENLDCYFETSPSVLSAATCHDGWIGSAAVQWLRSYSAPHPFFLSVNTAGPHAYRDPPGKYAQMYRPQDVLLPPDSEQELMPRPLRERGQRMTASRSEDTIRRLRAAYYGQLTQLDDIIGRLLAVLEERGILDETIILYTADHGEMLGEHGLLHKAVMYESAVRVPLLIRFPALISAGQRISALASLVDVAPTLLAAVNGQSLSTAVGQSLLPVLSGRDRGREEVFSELGGTVMIRRGSWKYIENPAWDIAQLFNLAADPDELQNLVAQETTRVKQLRERLTVWKKQTGVGPAG